MAPYATVQSLAKVATAGETTTSSVVIKSATALRVLLFVRDSAHLCTSRIRSCSAPGDQIISLQAVSARPHRATLESQPCKADAVSRELKKQQWHHCLRTWLAAGCPSGRFDGMGGAAQPHDCLDTFGPLPRHA